MKILKINQALLLSLIAFTFVLSRDAIPQLNFSITSTDATQFRNVKINFKAFDAQGSWINTFSPSDFSVIENGVPRPVLSASCPPYTPPALSLTLTFDISYSMTGGNRMVNAKSAATTMINLFSFPPTESGITTFHDYASIFLPYTNDKATVLTAISNLQANGNATDLFKGFMDPSTGAIPFTSTRSGKRVVIFLTDAYEILSTTEVNQIVAAANANNITIYTVLVISNPPPPFPLRAIATQTGGQWYEGVVTEQQAKDVYTQIARSILNPPPCEVVYQSNGCDLNRTGIITLTKSGNTAQQNFAYTLTPSQIGRITIDKFYIDFGVVKPPQTKDIQATITSRNRNVQVQSISSSNPRFTITSYGSSSPPFTLNVNQSETITIRYTPADTLNSSGYISLQTDYQCNDESIITGGNTLELRVVQPNGGEQLNVGSLYQIQWNGSVLSDRKRLEYSTDAGLNWLMITGLALGANYNWTVPNTPSTSCLMRVTSSYIDDQPRNRTITDQSNVLSLAYSRNGSMLISGLTNGLIKIWEPEGRRFIRQLSGHTGAVRSLAVNNIFNWFVSGSADRTVRVWRVDDGSLIRTINHTFPVHTVFISPDQSLLLSSDEQDIKIWNASNFNLVKTISGYSDINGSAAVNNQSTLIASVKGNNAYVIDIASGNVVSTLSGHTARVRSVAFSPDGSFIATSSDDFTIKIWRTSDGSLLNTFTGHSAVVTSVKFSLDGTLVLSSSNDGTIKFWQVIDGQQGLTMTLGAGINATALAPNLLDVAIAANTQIFLRGFHAPKSDISDSLWAIISQNASISAIPPTFRKLICANDFSTDTTIDIVNAGNKDLVISLAEIVGADSLDFKLITPASIPPDFTISHGQKQTFTLRFQPTNIGTRTATLKLTSNATNATVYEIPLSAMKDSLGVSLSSNIIDFGEVYQCTPTSEKILHIINTGTVPISVTALKFDVPDGYTISSPVLPLRIDPMGDSLVTIRFSPSQDKIYNSKVSIEGIGCNIQPEFLVTGSKVDATPRVSDTLIDFGFVNVGQQKTKSLVIKNITKSVMRITDLDLNPSSGDVKMLTPITLPKNILPSDSLIIDFEFTPLIDQIYSGTFRIETDNPCSTNVTVMLSGTSSRKPAINTSSNNFKTLTCANDTISDVTIIIENTGGQTLTITKAEILNDQFNDFRIISPASIPPGVNIDPGKRDSIIVRFKPSASHVGKATFQITSNASNDSLLSIPLEARKELISFTFTPSQIDFGETYECSLPLVDTIYLQNNSSREISIKSIIPNNWESYSLLDTIQSVIPGNTTIPLRFGFKAMRDGVYDAIFTVTISPCDVKQVFILSGSRVSSLPILSSDAMDFGVVGVGRDYEQEITLTNRTKSMMEFNGYNFSPSNSSFTMMSPSTFPFSIPAGGSQTVRLRYTPQQTENINAQLHLVEITPCSNDIPIVLTARGVTASATLSLPNLSAEIGRTILIPITMSNAQYFVESGVMSFRSTIQFNRTMLWAQRIIDPTGGTTKIISNNSSIDTARLTFEVTKTSTPVNGMIAIIEFLVMLGNAESTQLSFTNVEWLNSVVVSTLQSGNFTSEGICRAGGSRLVNAPKTLTLWQNVPNPFSIGRGSSSSFGNPSTTINYYLPKQTHVRIEVFNTIGKLVRVLVDEEKNAGLYSTQFRVSDISDGSTGLYYYKLSAMGETIMKRMVLIK